MTDRLEYFVSEKNSIVVVSFLGIVTGETIDVLSNVFKEVQARSPKLLILNCHDLLDMDSKCGEAMGRFNSLVKDLPCSVSYCFVHPSVRKILLASGTIDEHDIKNNFIEALEAVGNNSVKKVA